MAPNSKTKAKSNGKADPYHIVWEKMHAYEVNYAKQHIAEGETLCRLLHTKFLDSLSREQYLMYITCNGFDHMANGFAPRPNPRDVRNQCDFAGRYWTLDMVHDEIRKLQSLLLGRHVGTFYEENQRCTEAHKILGELAQASAGKAAGE